MGAATGREGAAPGDGAAAGDGAVPPEVSVVVATYRRPALLRAQIAALLAQRTTLAYEVVVVDDASGDDTAAAIAELVAEDGSGRLRAIALERNGGPAVARNAGTAVARGSVVAFTDDDCVAEPGWLDAIARPVVAGRADLVQGRTVAPPAPRDAWSHAISVAGPNRFETCNVAYRAELLKALGGFDESFRNAEDADLGHRALAAGARFEFVDDAVVEHVQLRLDLPALLRRRALAVALGPLFRRHPVMREQLYGGVLWRRGHLLVLGLVTAVGTAAATRHPRTATAIVAAWCVRSARPYRQASPLRRLGLGAGIVAADVVEVAATVRGAVRARTLLL